MKTPVETIICMCMSMYMHIFPMQNPMSILNMAAVSFVLTVARMTASSGFSDCGLLA